MLLTYISDQKYSSIIWRVLFLTQFAIKSLTLKLALPVA
jgi:hypothetical protein